MSSMAGYTKLFNSILASTVWREDNETRIVWITLLAMADKDGIAEGSVPGLADFARVPVEAARRALETLSSPDPDSRSVEFEGRRIEATEGGWRILNHARYRQKLSADERRNYLRLKQREYRERRKHSATTVTDVSDKSTPYTQAEAEAYTEAHVHTLSPPRRAPLVDQRAHRGHAQCGRVCLPANLFNEFVRRRNHDKADAEVRDWALSVEKTWAEKAEEPGDAYTFWRARYAEQWPAAPKDTRPAWARGQ